MSDRQYEVTVEGTVFLDADEVDAQGAVQAAQNALGFTGFSVTDATRDGEVRGA